MNACLPETDSPRLTLAMSFVGRTYLIIAITCSSAVVHYFTPPSSLPLSQSRFWQPTKWYRVQKDVKYICTRAAWNV